MVLKVAKYALVGWAVLRTSEFVVKKVQQWRSKKSED